MTSLLKHGDTRQAARHGHTLFFIILVTLAIGVATACAPQLKGIDLAKDPAPDFQLNDHRGNGVSMANLRGKVVVLTFLYTTCTDECPLIASKLHTIANQLGGSMSQVSFIGISVDPANDTPIAIQSFLQQYQLDGQLRYLLGTREQLQPVWLSYYIGATSSISGNGPVLHSARVIVIDKHGFQRASFESDLDSADLLFDIRALVGEQ
jgi:protein SCO1